MVIQRLYKMLWTRVGGRPWTYIVRDEQKAAPLVFMLIFLGLGILVVKLAQRY